ncbi:protocadherin gamma-A4-like [Babylonia areolata]|uniref:protocadherin gamma-A4-like n=1 Tax=Babylonia areolata TaxID=304850 RepID=UPI003FD0A206
MKGRTFSALVLEPLLLVLVAVVGVSEVKGQVSHVTLGPFTEQQRAGVMVGNVASASRIADEVSQQEFQSLRYEFLDPSNLQTASLFTLNGQTGGVFTSAMIDREAVCEYQEECLIKFDVTVSSDVTAYLRVISVAVNVTDVNDNVPTFPREEITLNIPEGNNVGMTYPLPEAVDKDTKRNSVVGYNLITTTSAFDLNVEKTLEDIFKISLYVNEFLDREERDRYLVRVTATDGGLQPLTGTLTVNINVTDINDNAPVFSKQTYTLSVVENAPNGTIIGRVVATDMDTGLNARITYSFSSSSARSKLQELFSIHPDTGEIQIIKPLQFASGNTFDAVIEARDNGFPRQETQAQLEMIIVDTGNNPPRIQFLPQNALYDNTVLIQENTKTPKLVGKMKVEDNDPGVSGTVNCQSSHNSFRIQKLEQGRGIFLVLLQKQLDREKEEKVNITISCSDAGAPPMTAVTAFSVIVSDSNDNAPVFSQHVYVANLTENAKKDVEVIRVSAHDYDKGINSQFYYYLHPRENEMFKLNSKTGVLTSNMVFDREVNSEVSVIIKAIDEGDQAMTGTTTVVVQILDQNDNAPTMKTKVLNVTEGGAPGRYVGQLSAHDRDLGVNAEVVFIMKATSPLPPFTVYPDGEIRTSSDVKIDRELEKYYELEIDMHDKGSPRMSSSAMVRVRVVDVNDNSPEVLFPNAKNNTVTIMWNHVPKIPFAHIDATDPDDGDNAKLSFFIAGGNKKNLFEVSPDHGSVSLRRFIEDTDPTFHRLKIAVLDNGRPQQQETQALLNIRVDLTNATFARHEGLAELERNILIAGIVGGATIVISIVILVVIFQVRTTGRHPRRAKDSGEWKRDKTGIQEECGKTEMEKVAWKMSHVDYKPAPRDPEDAEDEPDLCGPSDQMTMGKVVALPWSNHEKGAGGGGGSHHSDGDPHMSQAALDQYRKQDFYTFCKVRSPLDDVHSVTSGETTASDSGRGGSEDDSALPPIAEVPPECGSNQCLSLDRCSDRSTSPLSPVKPGGSASFGSPETKILPLSSFREPETRRLYANMKMSMNDNSGLHPYFGDKVHPSTLKRNHYMNQPSASTSSTTAPMTKHGSCLADPSRSLPHGSRVPGGSGRQVTFAQSKSLPRCPPPAYEHLLPDGAGTYTSFSRGIDDDDGNTTTSGSYTLDNVDMEDALS